MTGSWDRNTENFWPIWLAGEDGLSECRIFTFGYNSNFKGAGTNLNVLDFAKELLFQILTYSDGISQGHIPISQCPIIFVAHSMGGLVVKKAYIVGKHDNEYAGLISSVYGIVFLATPHRGAHYAKILNNILEVALGASAKAYVGDLDKNSSAIQDINEQFRTVCKGLSLFSFFETLKTNFGLTKLLIVEKESGILGYPQETSSPLNADHHTICKFKSQEDPSYTSVKNMLKLWTSRLKPNRPPRGLERQSSHSDTPRKLESLLGLRERPENDLIRYRGRVANGTCSWITKRRDFVQWTANSDNPQNSHLYWLVGLPATGKTTLASVVIDELHFLDFDCSYHFFNSAHQTKRKAAYCLRSIVWQLACAHEDFRQRLYDLHEESSIVFTSQNDNFQDIWDNIFEGIIFRMRFKRPLFWVMDAVDEADCHSLLINHLMKIHALTPIKVFLTSRPIRMPSNASGVTSPLTACFLSENDTIQDIRLYIQTAVEQVLPHDEQIQGDIIDQMLTKAGGSFLWVKLALETLQRNWHTQDDIRKSLTELPRGMEDMYAHMLSMVEDQPPRLRFMAKRILTWATCSWRPLSIAEMRIALEPEFKNFVNLSDTILEICGNFISLESSKVSLIHVTARDFLLEDRQGAPAFIEKKCAHEHIATTCLRHLSNDSWKQVFRAVDNIRSTQATNGSRRNRLLTAEMDHPFLGYATCYWAYHVSKTEANSETIVESLVIFLTRFCLPWIEAIALSSNLLYLIRSARYLKAYAKNRARYLRCRTPDTLHSLRDTNEDDFTAFHSWATDFIRIVGKFGPNLVQRPSSVQRLMTPFCPTSSMIGLHYSSAQDKGITVHGLPPQNWGDCLASASVGEEGTISKILASSVYFFTLLSSAGIVVVWYAETFEEARRLIHNEYIISFALNKSQNLLATAGIDNYRVWDVSSGKELHRLSRILNTRAMAVGFGIDDFELVLGLDDCSVVRISTETGRVTNRFVAYDSRNQSLTCPSTISLSPDLKKVAMTWRGRPPLVWEMTSEQAHLPVRCRVTDSRDPISAPEALKWQSSSSSLLVLCQDTTIVDWHIDDHEQSAYDHTGARELTISHDSNLIITGDSVGTISIWTLPRFDLVYRLINDNAFVKDLTFSPDGQRFYDNRGSVCNVWEPDVLVRLDERDTTDQSSVAESSTISEPVITYDESSESQVTALAYDISDAYYCCGREDGSVIIQDATSGRKLRKVYSHTATSSVIVLSWSRSGKYIVSADDSGRIITKRLETKEPGKWAVFPVFDISLDESVQQFLFGSTEPLILISTSTMDFVWNLKTKQRLCHQKWGFRQSRRWIEHPTNPKTLVWIDPHAILIFDWATLKQSQMKSSPRPDAPITHTAPQTPTTASCRTAPPTPKEASGKIVQWVDITPDKRHLIYETLPDTGHISSRSTTGLHLEVVPTSSLERHPAQPVPHGSESECIADLEGQVKRLVGTYKDRIVFLDRDFWLCSWRIDAGFDDVKRHFFLPKDWLNPSTLQIAMVNEHGTFFCPKHGDVGVVRGGMRYGLEPAF